MATETLGRPQINPSVADSGANREATRQRQSGVQCTMEDVCRYFYSIEETQKLVLEVSTRATEGVVEVVADEVAVPLMKRIRALDQKLDNVAAVEVTQGEDLRSFTVTTRLRNGAPYSSFFSMAVLIYRGLFNEDTRYERGDVVTWSGSAWHCHHHKIEAFRRPGLATYGEQGCRR